MIKYSMPLKLRAWDHVSKTMFDVQVVAGGKPSVLSYDLEDVGVVHKTVNDSESINLYVISATPFADEKGKTIYDYDVLEINNKEECFRCRTGNRGVVRFVSGCWIVMFDSPDDEGSIYELLYDLATPNAEGGTVRIVGSLLSMEDINK